MKILFISRAHPPALGGIEQHNAAIAGTLTAFAEVTSIVNRRGRRFLPFFLPMALVKSLWLVRRHDAVLLGDGVLAPVGAILRCMSPRTPVCCVVHGLDITWSPVFYQCLVVKLSLRKLDRVITVGNATLERARESGIPAEKLVCVPNGTWPASDLGGDPESFPEDFDEEKRFNLLTLGRLERRKGVVWFVTQVMPLLGDAYHYWVAGDGPDRAALAEAVESLGLGERVHLLGSVDDACKTALLHRADCFVQPNIVVPGDIEGFGLVVLEAAAAGLPVVAADLEGLKDAVLHEVTGRLVASGDARAFREAIRILAENPQERFELGRRAVSHVCQACLWPAVSKRYFRELARLVESDDRRE